MTLGSENVSDFEKLRNPKIDISLKNIIPIPSLLIQVFIDLPSTEPVPVALAFLKAMYEYDANFDDQSSTDSPPTVCCERDADDTEPDLDSPTDTTMPAPTIQPDLSFLKNLLHVIQFCHLCSKGKVPPIFYSIEISDAVKYWFSSLVKSIGFPATANKRLQQQKKRSFNQSESEDGSCYDDVIDNISSPDLKISKKDQTFLYTMLKMNEKIDISLLKSAQDKEEKEPGFARLEPHRKNLILNASAPPPP